MASSRLKPMHHCDDPATSVEAIERFDASGKRKTHCDLLLESIRLREGRTAAEVGAAVGLTQMQANRRLPDLMRDGLVRQGETKQCSVIGSECVTWWLGSDSDQRTLF